MKLQITGMHFSRDVNKASSVKVNVKVKATMRRPRPTKLALRPRKN